MRTITVEEFQTELKAQGVKSHADFAFRCPVCKPASPEEAQAHAATHATAEAAE